MIPETIFDKNRLRIGLVIGTYAALPYIHLQLETAKRFYPNVPILVHDDACRCVARLDDLCAQYMCNFSTNDEHLPDSVGDLSVYVAGLHWARHNQIDLLYKFSRRFLPVFDWSQEARALALQSQAATYSAHCETTGYGFRTECIGFHVPSWVESDVNNVVKRKEQQFVEGYMHGLAKRLIGKVCLQNDEYVKRNPMPHDRQGYTKLPFMGVNRNTTNPSALWHNADNHLVYLRQAKMLGLHQYTPDDFYHVNGCR